jgi:hypothetical protein
MFNVNCVMKFLSCFCLHVGCCNVLTAVKKYLLVVVSGELKEREVMRLLQFLTVSYESWMKSRIRTKLTGIASYMIS